MKKRKGLCHMQGCITALSQGWGVSATARLRTPGRMLGVSSRGQGRPWTLEFLIPALLPQLTPTLVFSNLSLWWVAFA